MSMMLSHLLSFGFFPEHVVLGSDAALHSPVNTVVAATAAGAVATVPPRSLVVFGRVRLHTDLAIRLASHREAAGLLLPRPPGPLPSATRALAERSGVPLVLVDHAEPDRLVPTMDGFVRSPDSADATLISVVAHRLRAVSDAPADMVRVLANTLRHPVGLVDTDGRVVAGTLPGDALPGALFSGGHPTRPAQRVQAAGPDSLLVLQPVQLTTNGPVNLWLAALVPLAPAARVRTTSQALSVATWAFVAHLATTAVHLERRSKDHAALLGRLLTEATAPHRQVVEQATAAGWRLGGRHTGVHVRARGIKPAAVAARLGAALAANGVDADPIPDEDGWSLWTTEARDAELPNAVREALLTVEHELPGVRLCAGIGTAADGMAGLRDTLREARRACVLAAARNVPGAVEHIGADNVKRLLSNRYLTAMQLDLAHELLHPLLSSDPTGQLVHTLSCYLDNESSATATAAALGVHRNTVLQRLDRIRSLLTVEFNDADERLALHLATRLVQSDARRTEDAV
jgi:PucR-like helix-turn-helix protein/diguanylate cyclase with GGDEF domain